MSVKVMGRVWDADIPPNHKLVLLAYADAAEHDGTGAYPGWERLVEMTGYSRSQVERITSELIGAGLLRRVRGGRRGVRAEFTVTVSQSATQPAEIVSHQSGDSVAQLRVTSRPDPSSSSPNGDGIFEAFYEHWFGVPFTSSEGLTRTERARLNAAVKEARLAGITPDEIGERGKRYRQAWSKLERTPQALLANWTRFAPEAPRAACTECGNRGVIWYGADGERTRPDDPEADSAIHCPACHPEVI